MEEKLYFKPETTDGKKKEPEKKNHRFLKLFFFLSFLVFVILIIVWLLKGKTTTVSEKIPNVKSTLISCNSDSIKYPALTDDEATGRELDIKIVVEEDSLKSISLEYSLFYDSMEAVKVSETHNHANMNISFRKAGLSADNYDAKYTILSDRLRMNLYATEKKLDETAKQYFLVKTDGEFPTSGSILRQNYESQGFVCEKSE